MPAQLQNTIQQDPNLLSHLSSGSPSDELAVILALASGAHWGNEGLNNLPEVDTDGLSVCAASSITQLLLVQISHWVSAGWGLTGPAWARRASVSPRLHPSGFSLRAALRSAAVPSLVLKAS